MNEIAGHYISPCFDSNDDLNLAKMQADEEGCSDSDTELPYHPRKRQKKDEKNDHNLSYNEEFRPGESSTDLSILESATRSQRSPAKKANPKVLRGAEEQDRNFQIFFRKVDGLQDTFEEKKVNRVRYPLWGTVKPVANTQSKPGCKQQAIMIDVAVDKGGTQTRTVLTLKPATEKGI